MKKGNAASRILALILCFFVLFGTVLPPQLVYATEADPAQEEPAVPDGNAIDAQREEADPAQKENTPAIPNGITDDTPGSDTKTTSNENADVVPNGDVKAASNENEDAKQPEDTATVQEETTAAVYNEAEYISAKASETVTLEAVLAEGEGSSAAASAVGKLKEKYDLSQEKLGGISSRLFADLASKAEPIAGKDYKKGGSSIDGFSAVWVGTDSSTLAIDENTSEAILQINYLLSSDKDFAKGDIRITIPASVLHDANGNPVGELRIPYEKEPSEKNAFCWKQEGGHIVLTNTRPVHSLARGYFQIAFTSNDPLAVSAGVPFRCAIEVRLSKDAIGLQSKELVLAAAPKEEEETAGEKEEIVNEETAGGKEATVNEETAGGKEATANEEPAGKKEETVDKEAAGEKDETVNAEAAEDPEEEKKEKAEEITAQTDLLSEEETEIIPENKNAPLLLNKNLSAATRNLTAGPLKAPPSQQTPVTADHITIEKVTIRWVSASTDEEQSALYDDLILKPTNDIVPNQQWQLDVAFSGKDEIKAGDLEIVLPAYIWLDRDENEPGIVTVAVPREGEEGKAADFVWKRVGDSIVVTNNKNLSAATKYMIQGTFRMTSPDPNSDPVNFTSTYAHQMKDGIIGGNIVKKSSDLFGVINVTTPNTGETISMTSNSINAVIDTFVKISNASKTAYDKYKKKYNVYYDYNKADIPAELLPANPEDYLFIKWYVDGRAAGNQPFTMITEDTVSDTIYRVEGTTETPLPADGLMLGAVNTAEGTVKSTNGKTIKAKLFEGFTEDDKAAYVWTAYKKSDFEGPGDVTYKVYNSQKVTVKGMDDGVVTDDDASASVAIRLPIVWTIKKEWIYNEDKYDTPLDVIKSRQPETLDVWLDNKSTGKKKVFTDTLSDENNWETQYEDDGVVANYDAYEHSYEVTRHMHGEDGTSVAIVTGKDDTVYTANGRWYYKYWGYDHKSTKFDEETHTWTFVNDYHEGVVGGGYDNFEVSKEATNHTDQNQKSTADKDLNLLRNGQNSTSINYDVHTGTFCLAHTSAPGAQSWETDKHGKRYVTLELHDYGEYFESRKLRDDEFRLATVTMKLPEIYKWVPEKSGSENGEWVKTDPVPVNLYGRGGSSTAWTLYAVMNPNGSITTHNGATARGTTVSLPEGINETMETIRTNGGRAYLDYNVGVILFPSKDIQDKIEEIFESTDYAKATSFNYVTGRLLDDDKNVLGELERYDRTYLHGRQMKLAVDLDKRTSFISNNKTLREFVFENRVTLNQQSNIPVQSDYQEAFDSYLLPGSKSGTFYDLLPEGMIADINSVRIENGTAKVADVIEDYKGTGRQLLIVKAELYENIIERGYSTRDSKRNDDSYPNITDINSSDRLYGTKATLIFNSWYSYDEAKNRGITNLRNTAAYEADEETFGNISKWSGEKDAPTGDNHKESLTEVEPHLRDAMTNLDAEREDPNFVYAGSTYRMTETDFDGLSSLRKYVQESGDEDWVTGLDNSVYVYEGGKYNYKIVLTSDTDTITKDIILIDSIEYYTPMEIITSGDTGFKVGQIVSKRELDHVNANMASEGKSPATAKEVWYWKGYFKSVDVSEMEAMGVDVKVYYSTVPDLDITHDAYNPHHTKDAVPNKLADTSVWSTELPKDPSKVTAIAFDCRKAKDGSDFELHAQEALIAYVHMQAPTYEQQPDAYSEEDYNDPLNNGWAYNNVYMDITQIDEEFPDHETHSYDHYDYTKVGIWGLDVEVNKVWEDENDNDRVRPDSVEVRLIREGVDTGRSLTLDESNDWKGTFPHVLMFDEDGNRIYYTLNENPVDEYISRVEFDSHNMNLINHRDTEKINIPFMKRWTSEEPAGWEDNIPRYIKVRLYADGVFTGEVKTVRADENGNWSGIFTGMNKYKDGVEIVYTIEEDTPENFISTIDQENKIITNTYYPYGDLSVEKNVLNGTTAALGKAFTYTLTLKDADNESVPGLFSFTITGADGVEVSSGQIGNGGTFTLKDQEKITIKDLNAGIQYEIKENQTPGFTLTKQTASKGTIVSGKEKQATFENTYHSYGSVSFDANKTLTGREMERYQFRFEVLDEEGNVVRLASNKLDGKVSFGAINYTEADDEEVYTYTIREINRGKGGYTYDNSIYTAEVRPVDNGDGTMTCTVTYQKDDQPVDSIEFKNEYHAEGEIEFKAWKQLQGRSLTEGEFEFVVTDPEGNVVTDAEGNEVRATNSSDGSITFPKLHFDETDIGKAYDFYVKEVKGTDKTVNYSTEGFNYHVVVSDNGDGTLSFSQDVTELKREYRLITGTELDEYIANNDTWVLYRKSGNNQVNADSIMFYDANRQSDRYFVIDLLLDLFSTGAAMQSPLQQERILETVEESTERTNEYQGDITYYYFKRYTDGEAIDQRMYWHGSKETFMEWYNRVNAGSSWAVVEPLYSKDDSSAVPVFTNTLKNGKLSVEKHVANPEEANPEQTFKFRVEFEGDGVSDKEFYGSTSKVTGMINVPLIFMSHTTGVAEWLAGVSSKIADSEFFDALKHLFTPYTVHAEPGDIDSGNYDGVDWRITAGGELIIGKEGETQEFEEKSSRSYSNYPWYSSRDQITSVRFAGPVKGNGSMAGMFYSLIAVTSLDLTGFDTSQVTSMSQMFYNCRILPSLDVSGLDTSNVTSFYDMFYNCTKFETLDLSHFTTSKVRDTRYMFQNCTSLKSVDMSGFDTSSVTTMAYMFSECGNLTKIKLSSGFNFVGGTEWSKPYFILPKSSMKWIRDDKAYGPYLREELEEIYTSEMAGTWVRCTPMAVFNTSDNSLHIYNADTALDYEPKENEEVYPVWFGNLSSTAWHVNNGLTFNIGIPKEIQDKVVSVIAEDEGIIDDAVYPSDFSFYETFKEYKALESVELSKIDWSKVTYFDETFAKCEKLKEVVAPYIRTTVDDFDSVFYQCNALERIDISGVTLSNNNTSGINLGFGSNSVLREATIGEGMRFAPWSYTTALPKITNPLTTKKWKKKGTDMAGLTAEDFRTQFNADPAAMAGTWVWEYLPIAVFDSADGSLKFYNSETAETYQATSTQTVYPVNVFDKETTPTQYTPDRSKWCKEHSADILSVTVVDEGIAPVSTAGWFSGCKNLTSVDMSKLDTSKTVHMQSMFSGCTALETLDLSAWKTPNLESLYYTFSSSNNIKTLDISGFDSTNVTYFDYAFPQRNNYNSSVLSKVVLGEKWVNWGSNGLLPTPPEGTTTGKWVREDGTIDGLTPSELRTAYINNPPACAGTWIWEPKAVEYTVEFRNGGGTGEMPNVTANALKDFAIPKNKFVNLGYIFSHWKAGYSSSSPTYTDTIPANTYKEGDTVTLTAQWTPIQGLTNLGNGVYEFELQDDMKMTIGGIPAGTTYRVYEETPDGWVLVSQSGENGTIKPTETSEASFTNRYEPGTTSVQFNGAKHLDGEPASGFTFVLKEGENEIQRVTSTNGMIQFRQITYDSSKVGIHTYTIEEVKGTDNAIEYDTHVETITVEVSDKGDGTMSKTVTYGDEDGIVFENKTKEEYTKGSLTIEKAATKPTTDANKDDEFSFLINLTSPKGVPYTEDVTYTVGAAGEEGTAKTATPSSGSITITGVKIGDFVKIKDLPKDVTYVVTETNIPRGWSLKESEGESGAIKANEEAAAKFTNEYKASGSVSLEAHKRLEGGTIAAGKYTFELQEEDGTFIDSQTNDRPDSNAFTLGDNDESVANPWFKTAPISFAPIDYTEKDIGKTFTYKIVEEKGEDGTVEYDEHVETVKVTVSDNGSGYLTADVEYANSPLGAPGALFTNRIVTGSLSLKKEISHYTKAAALTEFSFTVTLNDAAGNELGAEYPYVKTVKEEAPVMGTRINVEGVEEEYDTGETEVITRKEEGTVRSGDTVTLKGGDEILISGLPNGATYGISESDAPGWTLSESSNADGTITAGETKNAVFENVYTTEGSVRFEASKTLIGRELTSDIYKFIVEDSEGNTVDYAFAKEDGSIVFNGIDYAIEDDGKIYVYYIKEVDGDEEDISYDSSSKEVTVRVNDNGTGELLCDVTYDEGGMEFVNEVSYSLTVSKEVVGEEADPERTFTFFLDFDENQKNNIHFRKWEGEMEVGDGVVEPADFPYEFTLTAKERIVFSRVQDGAMYTLTEKDDEYYTAYTPEKTGMIEGANAEETFTNEINWFDTEFEKISEDDVPIKGARLAIYQGEERIEEWTTEGKAHIAKLLPGDYVLKEEAVSNADMYQLAADIPFTVGTDGSVTYDEETREKALVTMVDDYVRTEVMVVKTWDDWNDQDGLRPAEVTVKLLADGKETGQSVVLNEANDWTHIFADLIAYENEKAIVYTVEEEEAAPYVPEIIGNADTGFEIVNRYTPEIVDISGKKVWEDKNDKDKIRPEFITIRLLADGEEVEMTTVTKEADWSFVFLGLPGKRDGKSVVYTITEDPVKGYQSAITGSAGTGFTVTNTHTPKEDTPKEDDKPDDKTKPKTPTKTPVPVKTPTVKKTTTARTGDPADWKAPLFGLGFGLLALLGILKRRRA